MLNAHFDDRDGDWPRYFLAGLESGKARGTQVRDDEWSMCIHLNTSSTMQVAIVERVCYTIRTERSASENLCQ